MKTFVPLSNLHNQSSPMDALAEKRLEQNAAAQRVRLTPTIANAMNEIAVRWGLTASETTRLLALQTPVATESRDFERVSCVLGVYRALVELFGKGGKEVQAWLRAANSASPFGDATPIELILGGKPNDLKDVRRYLECLLVM